MSATSRIVARWESRSGKHYAELLQHSNNSYSYIGFGCGGYLAFLSSDAVALAIMEDKIANGYFQPDANTTPMRRTR